MPKGKIVCHFIGFIAFPLIIGILPPFFRLFVDIALADIVKQCRYGDTLLLYRFGKDAFTTLLLGEQNILVDAQGCLEDIQAMTT